MAENSAIEWCHHTFNPWIGCTKVGPGCDHCYAEILAASRLGVPWGPGAPRRRTQPSTWLLPRRWDRKAAALGIRQRVFCASLADVFDNEVSEGWRIELFQLIRETPNLDWLLVTKRIGNAQRMAEGAGEWPANVWLGATIVDQAEADRDVPKLLATNGPRFRFLSMEPLLGPVDLRAIRLPDSPDVACIDVKLDALLGCHLGRTPMVARIGVRLLPPMLAGLNWIIVGGESGAGARPMHPDWARSLRDQCAAAGVPFLFKQWGEWGRAQSVPSGTPGHYAIATRSDIAPDSWGGRVFEVDAYPRMFALFGGSVVRERLGKKAAGRLLDDVQHDGYPDSSGGEPEGAPLTESDAPTPTRAGVSAPKAAQSDHALAAAKPETPSS